MAPYKLFDLTYKVAVELGVVFEGVVTSGATTYTIDAYGLKHRFHDDFFKNGVMWVIYDAGGAGAAPEGSYYRVDGYEESTGKVTHENTGTATAAGDRYALANSEYPIHQIIQAINTVLSEIEIPVVDTTTTSAADTTEYDLPEELLGHRVKVWFQRVDATDDNRWTEYSDWYIAETATGTAKKLIFRSQPPEPWTIKIEYWIPHPPIYTAAGEIAEAVSIQRLVGEVVLKCLMWKKNQKAQDDPILNERIGEMMNRVLSLRRKYPDKKPGTKLAHLGQTDSFNYDTEGNEY